MRNRITTVIMLISIVLLTIATVKGIKIGDNGLIPSISELNEKNDNLNKKIKEASQIREENYQENIEVLESTFNKYKVQKQKYEELTETATTIDEGKYETKQYDIAYLWRILGKYANNRGLAVGIKVEKNNVSENSYNINFTVEGEAAYVNISQFITDLENDSDLYFKIDNFKMASREEEGKIIITANFSVKNINIDPSTIAKNTASIE